MSLNKVGSLSPVRSTSQLLKCRWERADFARHQYLVVRAYFSETWTQKILADEKINRLATKYIFNPRLEPMIRDRIPTKYSFRLDWLLKEFASEQSCFTIDPSAADPTYHVFPYTRLDNHGVEIEKKGAYIEIISEPFDDFTKALLRKVEKAFPPSRLINKLPEGWLNTWLSKPPKPCQLFSFPTTGLPGEVLRDLDGVRSSLEKIGPAQVAGLKLVRLGFRHTSTVDDEPQITYYPFKDSPRSYYTHSGF